MTNGRSLIFLGQEIDPVLRRIMDRFGDQFPMSNAVASQLIRYDLTRLIPVTFEQSSEESLGLFAISACLQEPTSPRRHPGKDISGS
jgi:hypothetical protein